MSRINSWEKKKEEKLKSVRVGSCTNSALKILLIHCQEMQ